MGRRRARILEGAALRTMDCCVCPVPGIAGVDVFPYWWGLPIGHKWCHSACAGKYRAALAAARKKRAVAASRPVARALDRSRVLAEPDMARRVVAAAW